MKPKNNLLPMLAALLGGTAKLPEVRRIRRGETAGERKNSASVAAQLRRIELAKAKRARKAAIRLELAR